MREDYSQNETARTLVAPGQRRQRRQVRWVIPAFALAAILILVCCLGGGKGERESFCVKCGLLQNEEHISLFGVPILWRTEYWPSSYTGLYTSVFRSPCSHQWRLSSEGGSDWLGQHAWVSCGDMPFTSGQGAFIERSVAGLKGRDRLATILSSFDFSQPNPLSENQFTALQQLTSLPDGTSQDSWWAKNQHLFISPGHPAGNPIAPGVGHGISGSAHR